MKFQLDHGSGRYVITGYRAGAVLVNGEPRERSFILTPDQLLDWAPATIDQLAPADLAAIAALDPEVVLLGTGAKLRFPPAGLLASLTGAGIGVECMDTGAACRAFAVLSAEGRRVAAALIVT